MTESVEWERLADHEEGAPEPADSWYDDARITEVQLDAIRSDLGDNGRAQYSRAAMRKVMAEIDRLQGHLNAIAVAHEEGVMARRRLDEIRDEDNAALKQRARAAERYIDQLRSELTTARGAMEILRGAGKEQCARADAAEAERDAARRELAEVRELVGNPRYQWASSAPGFFFGPPLLDEAHVRRLVSEINAGGGQAVLKRRLVGDWMEVDDA